MPSGAAGGDPPGNLSRSTVPSVGIEEVLGGHPEDLNPEQPGRNKRLNR
jgi:hypothetical protein